MALYQHTYHQYAGPTTPLGARFLIIPRYAYKSVFQSRLFTGLYAVCFAPLLLMTIMIYLRHNLSVLSAFGANLSDLGFTVNGSFFRIFTTIQTSFGFILTVIIGPALISRDLSNNALPLYLCRPLTRFDYVLGKMSVIVILLSLITWVPLLLLFLFNAYLEGGAWIWQNLYIAGAVLIISWTWIILLSLLSVALSAWVKWRLAASALLFAIFVVPTPITLIINEVFHAKIGALIHPGFMMSMLTDKLFRTENMLAPEWMVLPAWSLGAALGVIGLLCIGLLALKVRAYEVIK